MIIKINRYTCKRRSNVFHYCMQADGNRPGVGDDGNPLPVLVRKKRVTDARIASKMADVKLTFELKETLNVLSITILVYFLVIEGLTPQRI